MYAKIAIGNIRRSFGDYSIYFMTLAFAACLLYSFTASTDYLLALDLSEQQRGVYDSANGVMQAFSVFSVIVFAFLIVYANRFILRRRSREFALYEILGMPASSIARILAYEGCIVGPCHRRAGGGCDIAALRLCRRLRLRRPVQARLHVFV